MDRFTSGPFSCAGIMLALVIAARFASPAGAENLPARDFASDYPAGCSPEQARAVFVRTVRELRAEHRAAIVRLADEFESKLNSAQRTAGRTEAPEMEAAARKSLAVLRLADDAQSAIQLTLQYRSRLSSMQQHQATAIVERLNTLVQELQRAKMAYRPHWAAELRARWDSLDRSEKQEMLGEYFALAGEAPEWLLRHGAKAPLPLPRSTGEMLQAFQRRAAERLRTSERAFQPQRDALAERVQAARVAASATEDQRRAMESLQELLAADYGNGFRGMMLLEPDGELPADLRAHVTSLCQAYRGELVRLRTERSAQLNELEQVLSPLRQAHLQKTEFAELMAIDIRLHELESILRPLRILAYRERGIEWPEEVLLLEVRGSEFHVRFLRDEHEAWLGREQVLLKPTAKTIRDELAARPPADGPGTPVTDRTVLHGGQTLMGYRNANWYAASVVDVSPFGVIISWQGFSQEVTQLEPRSQLRLVDNP